MGIKFTLKNVAPMTARLRAFALASLLPSVFAACSAAALAADASIGMVKVAKGGVSIHRGEQRLAATPGLALQVADRVVTAADGAVGIALRDNTLLSAGPNSSLSLDKYAFDGTSNAGTIDTMLKRGTLSVVSGKIAKQSPESVRFRTPTTTLGVRGTEFVIETIGAED